MASDDDIPRHCREINRCNQRGGRMLSVVDLIEAGTMTVELAAYCLAAIGGGASFMVGAMPGGAGKTTVMGALLNFVPAGMDLVPADGQEVIRQGRRKPSPPQCFICHEIGSGPYYAYLWGQDLRDYFSLAEAGRMLATNNNALYTFSFLTLLYFAVFSIESARERRGFWATMPSRTFLLALAADALTGTVLTFVGLPGLMPLPWWQTLAVFAYAMVSCLVINDAVKVTLIKRLVPTAAE